MLFHPLGHLSCEFTISKYGVGNGDVIATIATIGLICLRQKLRRLYWSSLIVICNNIIGLSYIGPYETGICSECR